MEHLTFSLIQPYDITIIQQMVQQTRLSGMNFNRQSMPIFVARSHIDVVGFTCGQKGYGDQSHILTFCGTYLYQQYNDPDKDPFHQNQNGLQLAMVNWAKENLGVTHYKLHEDDEAKPIDAMDAILAQIIDTPAPEEEANAHIDHQIVHEEFGYH